ncbi:MAG: hypothetical protein KBD76_07100, partial [Bacteriovorax sp.]|nr:hypothetical protein [Bacteriovorax sp.]
MKTLLFLLILVSFKVNAWTIANSSRSGFQGTSSIDVYIAADSCPNANLTASSIEALARDAVEEFWDKVSTSSLKLNIKSITTTSLSGDT